MKLKAYEKIIWIMELGAIYFLGLKGSRLVHPKRFFSIIMITRKVKINLKYIQQSPKYNILYNRGKIRMVK